ncbi:hypothetical protein GYMLUDRAFT_245208 [Collybiopsis luxurians FD-317 M1]|uniref:Uncharacterized protein n=1 Tax=Collybiopsis luxurians FD-317 M1 TaxID=944289 RepID=A0A0D0CLU5_9AGAR|nr:hypothetical protein GYMLUDRAFT_245208 [Collybiopsis luxurians FD-317 M1]
MGPCAFAYMDINKDFFPSDASSPWSHDYSFQDNEGAELSANIFGEIAGPLSGTLLSAMGNHYSGPNQRKPYQLTDHSKARNVIVVTCPSNASSQLQDLFHNQICMAVAIRDADCKNEQHSQLVVETKEFIRSINTVGKLDALVLSSGLIASLYKKRNINVEPEPNVTSSGSSSTKLTDQPLQQKAATVQLGAHYDPTLLKDYGGPVFAQKYAKLLQQDWTDEQRNLIPPWDYYEKLQLGTLIVANVNFKVFVSNSCTRSYSMRKMYTAVINSLKVLAPSYLEGVPLSLPCVPSQKLKCAAISALDDLCGSAQSSSLEKKVENENSGDSIMSDCEEQVP